GWCITPRPAKADAGVEGRQPAAAQGALPPGADGRPVQPGPQGVLRAAGRGRQAADASRGGVHAQAGDGLLRGAQEPDPVRPRLGLTKGPLTTRYLVMCCSPCSLASTSR